jgi:lipopolysaccharide export LptBFGC system permease protein LptF
MKKWLIGSLVGAIIVFGWQAASWMFLGIHDKQMKYTPAQTEIMSVLSANLTEDGLYSMPSAPTKKEQRDMVKGMEGKPWASVIYHKEFHMDMAMPMIRGFLIDIFLVISLIYVLTRGGTPISRRVFSGSVAMGLAFWLWGPYTGHVWFQLPWHMIQGDLIDALVAWSLCGLWLGWWLNRGKVASS